MSEEPSETTGAEERQADPPTPFQILCGSLGAQVHMALGLIPDPVSKEAKVEFDVARQGIGLLEMLGEKTQGNLTEVESKTLGGLLAQIRMIYVHRLNEAQEKSPEDAPSADEQETN